MQLQRPYPTYFNFWKSFTKTFSRQPQASTHTNQPSEFFKKNITHKLIIIPAVQVDWLRYSWSSRPRQIQQKLLDAMAVWRRGSDAVGRQWRQWCKGVTLGRRSSEISGQRDDGGKLFVKLASVRVTMVEEGGCDWRRRREEEEARGGWRRSKGRGSWRWGRRDEGVAKREGVEGRQRGMKEGESKCEALWEWGREGTYKEYEVAKSKRVIVN